MIRSAKPPPEVNYVVNSHTTTTWAGVRNSIKWAIAIFENVVFMGFVFAVDSNITNYE